jgi:acyl-coenzyme A thioesterase PaaI-like protein
MKPHYFQDRMHDNHCYGCGAGNAQGLRLKSCWQGDEAVATFSPQPHHCAGPQNFLNGGVIATVIDCHCVCTAIAEHYRREQREIGSEPQIRCVTALLKVDYLKPVAIDRPLELRAQIAEAGDKKIRLLCSLLSGGQECARGEVLAIRVPASWSEQKRA